MLVSSFTKCTLSLAVAAALTAPVLANEQAETQDIERIPVWGTQVKASSVYLNEETMAIKQADHLSDLLRTIPGVDVGGAHSLNQRISIRSMGDKDLRISIDGANQNTYMYHHMGNLQIHADILESVDIEVGTNSVLNGGLGGSVRFETKSARALLKDDQKVGARVQATYGDNSGTNLAVSAYGQMSDAFDVIAYYNKVDRDDYEVGGGKIKDQDGNIIPNTDGEVKGFEGDLDDVLVKLGWDINDEQRFEIGFESYKDEGDYSYRPDMGLATDMAITDSLQAPLLWPTEFTRDTITLNYDVDFSTHTSAKFTAFSNTSELWRDENGWGGDWAAIITGEATNTGFNVLASTALDSHELTYGIDIINYETDYKAVYTTATIKGDEEADNVSLFIQDRIQLSDKIALIPGVRYDQSDLTATLINDDFDKTSGALAAEFAATDRLLFKLSATQLFKAPELAEVFIGAGTRDLPNPEIDAETGLNTEFSVAYADDVLGADNFTSGFTYFVTKVDDYIYDYATAPADSGSGYWKDNVGDMEIYGFEAYVSYTLGEFDALITFSSAESDLDAFAQYQDLDDARIDRQQGDTFSLETNYYIEALNLTLHWDALLIDDVDQGIDLDGAPVDNSKEGYSVHNISARWQPSQLEALSLTLGVDNLFDEYYTNQSSRTGVSFHPRFQTLYLNDYEPGRNIKATVAYQF